MVRKENIIVLDSATIKLRDDEILEVEIVDFREIELSDAKAIVAAEGHLTSGKKVPALHMLSKYLLPNEAVRAFSASPEGTEFTCKEAYVIHSLAQRIVGNFYIRFNKPPVPTKIFTDINLALKWLKK